MYGNWQKATKIENNACMGVVWIVLRAFAIPAHTCILKIYLSKTKTTPVALLHAVNTQIKSSTKNFKRN